MAEGLTAEEERKSSLPAAGRRDSGKYYLRIFAFFVFEVGFFALAGICWDHPFILDTSRLKNKPIAHGFTVVSVAWQTVALIAIEPIITDAFSREWSVRRGRINPGTTDRVSTISSGFLNRLHHSNRARRTFRLAFGVSLLLLVLTKLAPGTINAVAAPYTFPTKISVATLPIPINMTNEDLSFKTQHAYRVVQSEQIDHTLSGLKLGPELVVYPVVDPNTLEGDITYSSDVVIFQHKCHWKAPIFVNDTELGPLLFAEDRLWLTKQGPAQSGILGSSITTLSRRNISEMESDGTSAFLVIGGNDTFKNNNATPPTPFAINLGTLPTTIVEGGVGVNLTQGILVGPLATVLVCDPQPSISPGFVSLSMDGTVRADANPRSPLPFGPSPPGAKGAFPQSAANFIFTNALRDALSEFKSGKLSNAINDIASIIFMDNSTIDWNTATNIPPASLNTISKNMDTFVLSAAKAFIDGTSKSQASPGVYEAFLNETKIDAKRGGHRLVLTTSKGVFVVVVVTFTVALSLLIVLCEDLSTEGSYPFDLRNVLSLLQVHDKTLSE